MTLINETTDEVTNNEITAVPAVDGAGAGDGDGDGDNNGNGGKRNGAAESPMPGNVRPSDIVGEMQTAYLDYAMSVIVSRALPDVRDGLKPVHRRILYAMSHDLYLHHTKPHRKSARIVGEVLGKYHPHGDVAVYDAMVRMAQEFSLRYPLIDGQGNFGSIDGDGAAAMRYTEARLAEIAELMLADLDKDTVDWHDNFDNSLEEPDILPAALPNLLINGSSGIAVGMATNIPPHNLGEIVDALVYLIDRYKQVEEITVDELLQFVKGPDFPTGGILYRFREDKGDENIDVIAQGYAMGKARLVMQAKAHFEEMSRGRSRIVVTELPYQTNKTALIERIASLARDGKIEGITDLRDESDRTGMRIVIELTRNADPKDILKDLFKYTPLQQTFGMQMLALVDGQPRLLSLKRALHLFVQHREEIIRRRSEYDLAKARDRAHIVEGLLKALDILDEVIDTIRRSQTVETARNNLVKNFKFTEIQAQAILDMQLRRLAALERKKLKEEYDALMERIAYLEDLLAHPEKILAVIRADLLEQKEKYGDARRTQIVDRTKGTLTSTDLLPQQEVWISVSADGDLRRQDVTRLDSSTLAKIAKYGQVATLTANTRDWLYVFCRDGRCTRIPIHEIPQNGSPKHVSELSDLTRRDAITAALSIPRLSAEEAQGYLFLATALGNVKRVALADVVSTVAAEFVMMAVDVKDRLQWVLPTPGEQEIMLISAAGQSIRFSEEDVRSMGLAAGGVGGMKLKKGDVLVHADVVNPAGDGTVLTMTAQGYAKRSVLNEYSRQGRNGSGIVTHKPNNRTGLVTTAMILDAAVGEAELVATITAKKKVEALPIAEIPVMGRGVQGKPVVTLVTNDTVIGLKRVTESATFDPTNMPSDPAPDAGDGSAGNLPPTPTDGVNARANGAVAADAGAQVTGKTRTRNSKTQPAARKAERQAAATTPSATGKAEPTATTTQQRGGSRSKPKTTSGEERSAQAGNSNAGRAKRNRTTAKAVEDATVEAVPTVETEAQQPTKTKTTETKATKTKATKTKTTGKRAAAADRTEATHRQQPTTEQKAQTAPDTESARTDAARKQSTSTAETAAKATRTRSPRKQTKPTDATAAGGTHRQPKAGKRAPSASTSATAQPQQATSDKQSAATQDDAAQTATSETKRSRGTAKANATGKKAAAQPNARQSKRVTTAEKETPSKRSSRSQTKRTQSSEAQTKRAGKGVDKVERVTTQPQKATTRKRAGKATEAQPQTLELFPLDTVEAEQPKEGAKQRRKSTRAATTKKAGAAKPSATKATSAGKAQTTAQKKSRKLEAAVSVPNPKKKSKSR